MNEREYNTDAELQSFLNGLPKGLPYDLPSGYFENNANVVLNLVHDVETGDPVLSLHGREMPFEVPGGYFEGLAEQIVAQLPDPNLLSGKTEMAELPVPMGYFDELPKKLIVAAKQGESSTGRRTIALPGMRQKIRIRIAVAAAVLVLLGVGTLRFLRPVENTVYNAALSDVTHNDISEFMRQNYPETDMETAVNNVPTAALKFENGDIIRYLNDDGWDGAE